MWILVETLMDTSCHRANPRGRHAAGPKVAPLFLLFQDGGWCPGGHIAPNEQEVMRLRCVNLHRMPQLPTVYLLDANPTRTRGVFTSLPPAL